MSFSPTPAELEVAAAAENKTLLDEPHEHVVHSIDEESQMLIAKGYVPSRINSPYGQQVTWARAEAVALPWGTVILLVVFLVFILLIAWGRPW